MVNASEALPVDVPLWRSVFQYDADELGPWLDEHRSLTGKYKGKVYADSHVVLDFDGPESVTDVLMLSQSLLAHEATLGQNYQIWLSGGKGFHVWMPTALFGKDIKAGQIKGTIEQTFGHLKSLDTSMYHRAGLIRMPWSKHQKSGRQVIPVGIHELYQSTQKGWVYPQLYEHAEENVPEFYTENPTWDKPPVFKPAKLKLERTKVTTSGQIVTKRIMCMQAMVSTPPPEGERHDYVLRAASWLRRTGMTQDMVTAAMQQWTRGADPRDTARAVDSVFDGGLEFGCHDPVLDEHCNHKCIFYTQKVGMKATVRPFSDQLEALREFRRKVEAGKGLNLKRLHPFDKILRKNYWILPGECAVFTGDTGMGKSALVQNIIVAAQRKTLYLNLENSESLMTRRFIQIAMGGVDSEYVDVAVKESLFPHNVLEKLNCVSQVSSAPDLEGLEAMVKDHQPEILVVDTTDVIEVPQAGNNEMWQLKRIIEVLRKLAASYDIIVLGIHHINKKSSSEGKIDLNALSGNRANVTKMDHVFALVGIRKMHKRTFKVLKSRDGEMFNADMMFDGSRMYFDEIPPPPTEEEDDELDKLLD